MTRGVLTDLTSQRFGWLAVLQRADNDSFRNTQWECVCLCGNVVVVPARCLRSGATRSCGCFKKQRDVTRNFRHGMYGTPEYRSWLHAYQRTTNPNNHAWKDYGGRGIDIYPFWTGEGGFERFFSHIGPRPEGHTLDRIDNDKGYHPGNVRWATAKQQASNRRDT